MKHIITAPLYVLGIVLLGLGVATVVIGCMVNNLANSIGD